MTDYISITLDVTEDALFGDVEPPKNYNVSKYSQAVSEALTDEYPDVDIEVSTGNRYEEYANFDGDDRDWQATISHIVNTEWIKWLEGLEY